MLQLAMSDETVTGRLRNKHPRVQRVLNYTSTRGDSCHADVTVV